jgi:hypothetical protein
MACDICPGMAQKRLFSGQIGSFRSRRPRRSRRSSATEVVWLGIPPSPVKVSFPSYMEQYPSSIVEKLPLAHNLSRRKGEIARRGRKGARS